MSVGRNATYSLVAAIIPSVLTLITVPLYLGTIGVERYGILILCWLILGYSGLADIGLGPALARRIAIERGKGGDDAPAFWTALWLSAIGGLVAAAGICAAAALYFGLAVDTGAALQSEALAAIPLLAITAPAVVIGNALSGALQGRERFLTLSLLATLGNALLAILPLAFAWLWSPSLTALVAGTLAARLLPLGIGLWIACRKIGGGRPARGSGRLARELLSFGGWVSVAAVASAALATLDRVIIGALSGPRAVSAFSIPLSLVSRTMVIPHSLGMALLPRFSRDDREGARKLLLQGMKAVALLVTPASLVILLAAEPFFRLWIGPDLAETSTRVAECLTLGFWVYCIAYPLVGFFQAGGRPDLVAKVLLAQLLIFLPLLWLAVARWGVFGAALVVGLRPVAEAIAMWRLARIDGASLAFLLAPFALVTGGAAAAVLLDGATKAAVLAILTAVSLVWSLRNLPATFRVRMRSLIGLPSEETSL